METLEANKQEIPEDVETKDIFEKQIVCDGDFLIRDIESAQNEGTVVHTKYGLEEGKRKSWKNVPGKMV